MMLVSDIIKGNFVPGTKKFNRLDIVVRALYVESYINKKDIDIYKELYLKFKYITNFYRLKGRKNNYKISLNFVNWRDNEDSWDHHLEQVQAATASFESFGELIQSFVKHGFKENFPIPIISKEVPYLLGGAHRFAISLVLELEKVPVRFLPGSQSSDFTIEWFKKNNFNENEIKLILNGRRFLKL